jgi:hypothetical protein
VEESVAEQPSRERLAEKRQITLFVRLVLEASGALVYGEVVDLEGWPHGRFSDWADLPRVLRDALKERRDLRAMGNSRVHD